MKKLRWKIKKSLETNKNGNAIYQNLWDVANVVLRGNFITINAYIKETEKINQIGYLIMHLKN